MQFVLLVLNLHCIKAGKGNCPLGFQICNLANHVCILEKKFQGAAYSRSCPCRNAPVATMRKNYTANRYYYLDVLNVNHE